MDRAHEDRSGESPKKGFLPRVQRPGVPRPTIATNPVEITGTGHLTELLYDDGVNDDVLVCAAHGGAVEPGTGEQALELATRLGATCWATFGYDDEVGAFDAFHPPSSAIGPSTYDLLGEIGDRGFETVLSLHGLGEEGVLVGGGLSPECKRRVSDRLGAALSVPVDVAAPDGEYAGTAPGNFANWLAADGGGLQLEEGKTARAEESAAVLATLEDLIAEGVV